MAEAAAPAAAAGTPAAPVVFVVEHLEDDMGEWCALEYADMLAKVGAERLLITNIPAEHAVQLDPRIPTDSRSLTELGLGTDSVCLLDMRGEGELAPSDAAEFTHVVFGGILGDHPPRDRTRALRGNGFAMRHLRERQMSTSTAVHVCRQILMDSVPMGSIPFVDDIELVLSEGDGPKEVVDLPYRYIVGEDGQPQLPAGLLEYLKSENGSEGF